jgi:hypothetical protein
VFVEIWMSLDCFLFWFRWIKRHSADRRSLYNSVARSHNLQVGKPAIWPRMERRAARIWLTRTEGTRPHSATSIWESALAMLPYRLILCRIKQLLEQILSLCTFMNPSLPLFADDRGSTLENQIVFVWKSGTICWYDRFSLKP